MQRPQQTDVQNTASIIPGQANGETASTVDRAHGGGLAQRVRDFRKAYGKARGWHCPPPRSFLVALRFAMCGDSGRFRTHGGWRVSRIYKDDGSRSP